jgi:phytoene dehydrogenase-like protein
LFVLHVAPVLPAGRSWADPRERETFADLVIDTITAHAPNFEASVIVRARCFCRSNWKCASDS